jgi:hypothetical protein
VITLPNSMISGLDFEKALDVEMTPHKNWAKL